MSESPEVMMNPEDFTEEILNDHKLFRYGVDKRPVLPHERDEYGCAWILTDRGSLRARKLFEEMFPGYDFEKDSGIILI